MAAQDKFCEMILYLTKLSEADPRCGRTKLNKLLFNCDFRAYERLGQPISGQTYQKREFGPTPGAFLPCVGELERQGACLWANRSYHGKPMKRLVLLREPDLTVFGPEEVDVMRETVEVFWEHDASQISEQSHGFAGWQASEFDEDVPFYMVFVDDARPLLPEEEEWAVRAVREYRDRKALAS